MRSPKRRTLTTGPEVVPETFYSIFQSHCTAALISASRIANASLWNAAGHKTPPTLSTPPGAPWMHSCGNKSQLQSLHTWRAWSSVNTRGRSSSVGVTTSQHTPPNPPPSPVITISPLRHIPPPNKGIGPFRSDGIFGAHNQCAL